jgi:hypothetical protein
MVVCLLSVLALPLFLLLSYHSLKEILTFWGISTAISTVIGFIASTGLVEDNRVTSDLFEKICTALNIPNGEVLMLRTHTKKKIASLKISGEWIPPDKETTPMPQWGHEYYEDYFFYY